MQASVTDKKVLTGRVRLNYPILFEPRTEDDGSEKFSIMLMIPKDDAQGTLKALRAAEEQAIADGVSGVWGGKRPATIYSVIRDGDADYDTDERPEMAGHWILNVRTKFRPGVVDAGLERITNPEAIYSGCYGRVTATAFPYKNRGKTGVSFALGNVQFLGDGARLGGRPSARDEFTPVDVEVDFI